MTRGKSLAFLVVTKLPVSPHYSVLVGFVPRAVTSKGSWGACGTRIPSIFAARQTRFGLWGVSSRKGLPRTVALRELNDPGGRNFSALFVIAAEPSEQLEARFSRIPPHRLPQIQTEGSRAPITTRAIPIHRGMDPHTPRQTSRGLCNNGISVPYEVRLPRNYRVLVSDTPHSCLPTAIHRDLHTL